MHLSSSKLQFLISNIQNISVVPVYILDSSWNVVGTTETRETGLREITGITEACSRGEIFDKIEREFSVKIRPYALNGETIGYILILASDAKIAQIFPFIFTLLDLLFAGNPEIYSEWTPDMRTQLTNQIAFYGKTNWEIVLFTKILQYSFDVPRCAVLFYFPDPGSSYAPSNLQSVLTLLISSSPSFSRKDIFGPVKQDKFLVFKSINGATMREKIAKAEKYAQEIIKLFNATYPTTASAYIGSPYVLPEHLHESFLEAQFLCGNVRFLSEQNPACLTINKHIFAYFSSLLSYQYKELIFKDYDLAFGSSETMCRTLEAISTSNNNLVRAAGKLGIHRNTLLQRFEKIREALSADPLYSDIDRLSLYSYSLIKSQTITWHAFINIQPWNIQHRGLQKFAEILWQKSRGYMQMDIDLISRAGDYRQLFESVCEGKIDCVSVNTGPLFNALKDQPPILEFPFLFDSAQEADELLNGLIKNEMFPALYAMGAVLMNFWSMGWRYITSNEPVRVPDDMRDKRIRLMFLTKIINEYYSSIGATVVKEHYSDLPESLLVGIVNCQENPYSNILGMEFYKSQKYITEFNAFYDVNAVLFSKAAWERLSPELQGIVLDALRETSEWLLSEADRTNLEAKEELIKKGMQIIYPKPGEIALWKDAARGMYDSLRNHTLLKEIFREKEKRHDKQRTKSLD